ncbi:MAG: hypothetical protein LWY06_17045 [Firmicutes bacterium]|nr:hypothetical protein [Bacillota bacterium]
MNTINSANMGQTYDLRMSGSVLNTGKPAEAASDINTRDVVGHSEDSGEKSWTLKQRLMAAANGAILPYVDVGGLQIALGGIGAAVGACQGGGAGAAIGLFVSQAICSLPKAIEGFVAPDHLFNNLPHTSARIFFEPWE